jgi:hypothetical protein
MSETELYGGAFSTVLPQGAKDVRLVLVYYTTDLPSIINPHTMDQDEISNLYRGPSIDASYQVSVHLAEGFQRRRLKCEKLTDDRRQVMAKKAR